MSLTISTGTAAAAPEPSAKDLKSQAQRLGDELEQLTEKFNGLKVQLKQSQRAAQVAQNNAARQEKALSTMREQVGRLAATTYMNGGADRTVTFASSDDPQEFLDQAATLDYFAKQGGTQVQTLLHAMQSAQRARKAAEERQNQVKKLQKQIEQQRDKVNGLYGKVRDKIAKRDPSMLADLPPVAGSGKAAEALRYALGKLGRPYVWGAAGPGTFDCSGLTMWAYQQVGISLPHYTGSQWNAGAHVSRDQLQPGDLVFFHSDLHHMGMYIGDGKMVHAPHTGDVVRIAPIEGRPWAGAVRVA
jgi:cell wall-associated NlpC family hydrolase